jgi:hypothetical protein
MPMAKQAKLDNFFRKRKFYNTASSLAIAEREKN